MRLSRDLMVVVALFAVLIGVTLYLGRYRQEAGQQELVPDYSTHSSRPNGTMALYVWLDELGYDVRRVEGATFELDGDAGLLFVVMPAEPYDAPAIVAVSDWVRQGHTLVAVGRRGRGTALWRQFGAVAHRLSAPARELRPRQPLLLRPPVGYARVLADQGLYLGHHDYVEHFGTAEMPTLVSFRHGQGRVYLTTMDYPFTNEGLGQPGNAPLVYNLVAGLSKGSAILFDEYHHGFSRPIGYKDLLYRTPWGWALLYVFGVTLIYLLLGGQRFGRPVPLPENVARRSTAEYVVSMANLFRRAGRRTFVLRHHYHSLKRALARRHRLSPARPDAEFVAELARYDEGLDGPRLLALLKYLQRPYVGEQEMVRLVWEVERWRKGG